MVGPQEPRAPFLKAGPSRTVRPESGKEDGATLHSRLRSGCGSGPTNEEEKQKGEITREVDEWSGNAKELCRHHVRARRALFTPTKVDEQLRPCSMKEVGDVRVTRGTTVSGEDFVIHDFWRAAQRQHRDLKEEWTGTTTFEQRTSGFSTSDSSTRPRAVGEEEVEGEQHRQGDRLSPLGERMEKAQMYYPERDPETERSGGSSASTSHPSGTKGDQHGLGHHGGPDDDPEVIVLEEEGRPTDDHAKPIVVRVPRTPYRKGERIT